MTSEIFKYLRQRFSQEPKDVDRLIVSSFLQKNDLKVQNNAFIKQYIITNNSLEEFDILSSFLNELDKYETKFDFENLIELFEFVISPSEKVVNGAVYTPAYIRNYIIENSLSTFQGDLTTIKVADISCGCGGFLLTVADKLYRETDRTFQEIFSKNLYGVDIAEYSVQRTKILLSLYAIVNGEDIFEFTFNLFAGNSLNFNWKENCAEIKKIGGFDRIVGNPPYVCSRNMDKKTVELLKNWEVASTGHPDLYIPFFQIGLENLNPMGVLGYITVNTFIKSVNGRALRQYFENNNINVTIINFGGEQIFKDRNTYTCICFLRFGSGGVNYMRVKSEDLPALNISNAKNFQYSDLHNIDGWNLVNDQTLVNFITKIETTGISFKDRYTTKNGIATLKNDVYKFSPEFSDANCHYLNDCGKLFPIERNICRQIINANKLKSESDIERLKEYIIFPYDKHVKIIPEPIMKHKYPKAYAYLKSKQSVLSLRDKGQRTYEEWYAYGRRQSMDIHAYKLFFPHICERPTFVICEEKDLLFYNGIAVISDDLDDLKIIKLFLESRLFFKYISNSTKDYASGYISMSRNYLKNFGVYQLSDQQKAELLNSDDPDLYIENLYGLT